MTLFKFGVLSDIQYADVDNGISYKKLMRYYRNSLNHVKQASQIWTKEGVEFVLQLGDLVDGKCAKISKDEPAKAVDLVLRQFDDLKVFHTWGNHEFYCFTRDELLKSRLFTAADSPDKTLNCYSFQPHPKYRIVCLDAYDVALPGYDQSHPKYQQALKILQANNPHGGRFLDADGMVGVERRFRSFNGIVGDVQLKWLRSVLDEAANLGQTVVIFNHAPLIASTGDESVCGTLLMNYDQLMDLIHLYPCVRLILSGHSHDGGYYVDNKGVHHLILKGVVEVPPTQNSFATVTATNDALIVNGSGLVQSFTVTR